MKANTPTPRRKTTNRVSAQTFARIRQYAATEPSFTVAFAAWELGLSTSTVGSVVAQLLDASLVREIEPRSGPFAAVYQARTQLPELDSARHARAATLHVITQGTSPRELAGRELAYTTEAPAA